MTKLINALKARTQLGKLLDKVSTRGDRYLINRRGKPTAVVMGVKDFLENIVETPEIMVELQQEATEKGKDEMTMEEIEGVIEKYRKEND